MYGRIPESLQKNPDFKKFMKKAGPRLDKGYGKKGYKGATLTQGGKFGDSYTTPPAENLVNSKSLVRQGAKIGAKTSAGVVSKALRNSAKIAMKGVGAVLGMPAVIAYDLLDSKTAGTDQFGRALDTPDGWEAAKQDDKVADYFATYGVLPEGTTEGSYNPTAVISRVEGKFRSEQMANTLRQVNRGMAFMQGKNPVQETPEQMARKNIRDGIMNEWYPAEDTNKQWGRGQMAGAEVMQSRQTNNIAKN
jgi:hypothetical protein